MKSKLLCDSDGVIARWQDVLIEEVYKPGYFRRVRPLWEMLNTVRRLTEHLDVYIVSCSPNADTTEDKNWWWDTFIPEVPRSKRIIIPYSEHANKCDYLKELDIQPGDVALDDYSKNLFNYKAAFPQLTSIKVMNGINGTKGTWVGPRIRAFDSPNDNVKRILSLAEQGLLFASARTGNVA